MSDLVLARKYRPRDFGALVGQDHVVRALTHALDSGRLHHAYLFTGTRGIGKTTISRILAKSLNCTGADGAGGITSKPCGCCQACTEIDADRFIDYIELDAASNRSIDEVRDLIERAAYKPSVGRYKVFMIDEAHQLTKDAFNALLKTLEEPPEYLKFVLATTDPDKMLPTVLSRCLQFNLRPMAPQTVAAHLQTVLQAEGIAHEAGALRLLSRAARGSMRDALSLTDQAIAYGGGALQETAVHAMLGTVDRSHAAAIVQTIAQRDGAALLACVEQLRSLGLSAAGTLDQVAQLLQQMAIEQAVPGALDADDPDTPQARQLASALAADETQVLYSICLHGRAELGLMSDEYGALAMVLLRLFAFAPEGVPAQTLSAVPAPAPARADAGGRAPSAEAAALRTPPAKAQLTVPAPPWVDEVPPEGQPAIAAPLASAAPAPSALRPTALGERWHELVRALLAAGSLAALARELALQAELVQVDEGQSPQRWRLRVEREALRAPALRDKLQTALAQHLGAAAVIEFEPGVASDSPALRDAAERAQRQAAAEHTMAEDPVVRGLMAQFRTARIVPGSVQATSDDRKTAS